MWCSCSCFLPLPPKSAAPFDRFGAHHYDLGSDKPEFVVYEGEGGGLNANQTTICSLSNVAEALRIIRDLDVLLHLSG
jgi:hypothetical protein